MSCLVTEGTGMPIAQLSTLDLSILISCVAHIATHVYYRLHNCTIAHAHVYKHIVVSDYMYLHVHVLVHIRMYDVSQLVSEWPFSQSTIRVWQAYSTLSALISPSPLPFPRSHSDAEVDMELSRSPSKQTSLPPFHNGQHFLGNPVPEAPVVSCIVKCCWCTVHTCMYIRTVLHLHITTWPTCHLHRGRSTSFTDQLVDPMLIMYVHYTTLKSDPKRSCCWHRQWWKCTIIYMCMCICTYMCYVRIHVCMCVHVHICVYVCVSHLQTRHYTTTAWFTWNMYACVVQYTAAGETLVPLADLWWHESSFSSKP